MPEDEHVEEDEAATGAEHGHEHEDALVHEPEHEGEEGQSFVLGDGPLILEAADQGSLLLTGHVHGPGCGHDHDHEHEHEHGPGCDHDHEGEPHEHDDEHVHGPGCGHDHDRDHAPRAPRPPQTRPAEDGGTAVQLALADALPGETDEIGIFAKLELALVAHRGVTRVHIRKDNLHREVCIHYDAAALPLTELLAAAERAGVEIRERYLRKTYFVRGMESAQCAMVVEHALRRLEGVLSADVAYAAERLVVEYDAERVRPSDIEARAELLGYTLEVPEHGHVCSMHAHGGGLAPKLQMPFAWVAGSLIAAGLAVEHLLPALGWATAPGWVPSVIYCAALAFGGFFPLRAAIGSIRELSPDVETLTVLAGVGAAVLGAFFEGAFLLFLFSLGHALEHRAMDRARRSLEALGKLRPEMARVRRGGAIVELGVSKVRRGDVVLVRAGDRVPLDGVIREGKTHLDQATITGESMPVARGPGDPVYAGTLNTDAAIELEVSRLSRESVLARIVDMVAQAEAHKSKTQRFAQRLEKRFVPVVLGLAVLLPIALVLLGTEWSQAVLRGIALLVAASPCALAIATPSAILSSVSAAARGGVAIKGGAYLEALAGVSAIAFDKTGTLTQGKPELVAIEPAESIEEKYLLRTAAALETLSSHPLARAVVAAAQERELALERAQDGDAEHGKGIRGRVGGDPVLVGNLSLFDGLAIPDAIGESVVELEEQGRTSIVVRRGDRFLGVLGVADTLRPEAKATVERLGALGITKTVMLSGDNLRVARAVAAQAGISEARAPLMPEDKVSAVRDLAKEGGVAMVGDGVNDAPALAAASVGIAMGGAGSDAALETADIVLMGDALERLPFAVGLARKARGVVRQNLVIALGVSAILIVATVLGLTSIAHAVILHEGSTLVVVANALRLLRYR